MPFYLLLALLIFAPLAYGTIHTWSLTIFQFCALIIGSFWLFLGWRKERKLFKVPGLLPLLLFCLYILLQLIPLPPSWVQLFSSAAAELYQDSVWLTNPDTWMPLSLYPRATLIHFFRFFSYALIFFATVQIFRNTEQLRKATFILTCFGGIYAFFGLLQFFAPGERIFWILRLWPERTMHPFATYGNGNHYAGLMEMLVPLAVAGLFIFAPQIGYGNFKDRLLEFFSQPMAHRHALTTGALLLMLVSVFFSLSRGGMIRLFVSLLIFLLLLLLTDRTRSRALTILVVMILVLGLVGLFGWEPIFDRFEKIRDVSGEISNTRLEFWQDTLPLLADYPVTGSGFSSYLDSFPRYQTENYRGVRVVHAHNDYLELLSDGGVIALLLVLCFWVSLISHCYPAWRRRKNSTSRFLSLASFTGILAIFFHSGVDFNLAIPANGLWFFFLCGLLVAASHVRSGRSRTSSELAVYSQPKGLAGAFIIVLSIGAVGLMFNGGILLADLSFAEAAQVNLAGADQTEQQLVFEKAQQAAA